MKVKTTCDLEQREYSEKIEGREYETWLFNAPATTTLGNDFSIGSKLLFSTGCATDARTLVLKGEPLVPII
jgi:hypothetical protein